MRIYNPLFLNFSMFQDLGLSWVKLILYGELIKGNQLGVGFPSLVFWLDLWAHPDFPGIFSSQIHEGWQNTAGKTALTAVDTGLAAFAHQVIFRQEFTPDGRAEMLPWEGFIDQALAVGEVRWPESGEGKRIQPAVVIKMLMPGIKFCALFPGLVDHLSCTAVAARKNSFEHGFRRFIPIQF